MPDERFPPRMNPTDATLWDIKRDPQLRTTIVGVAVLDRRPDWDMLVARIERAVQHLPRLRQRVAEGPLGLGRPRWVDTDVDLTFHLRRVRAPEPRNVRAVLDMAGPIAGEEFDEARPLWEMMLIEDLVDDRAALILKVSHALTDGIGGVALLQAFDDELGEQALRRLTGEDGEGRSEQTADDAADPLTSLISVPAALVSAAVEAGLHPLRTANDVTDLAGSAARLLAPTGSPLSPLMTRRDLNRWIGITDIALEPLIDAAHRAGGTINDAFVTITMDALADYHRGRGVDADHLRVTMPVNFRSDDDAHAGNQWTPARFVLPLDPDAHPYDTLQRYRSILRAATHEPAINISQTLAAGVQELPPAVSTSIVAGMVKGSDVAITDVPGPRRPLTVGGARVTGFYPSAPTGGAALNVGLLSLVDTACIGLTVDTAAVTHPEELLAAFESRAASFLRRRRRPELPDEVANVEEPRSIEEPDGSGGRLTALDTSFLRMESPSTPMHMGGLLIMQSDSLFDAKDELDIEALRRHLDGRLAHAPRLLRKVQEVPFELGRPLWVDDPEFDIMHHVRAVSLPAPGSRTQLLELCEEIQMETLDRTRPLFELCFIVGLDPEEFGEHAVALVERLHHALLDGMSGVELLSTFFDTKPAPLGPPRPGPMPGSVTDPAPASSLRLATDAVIDLLQEPAALLGIAADMARAPQRAAEQLATVTGAIGDLVAPARAPRPSLNQPVGDHRRLLPVTASLDQVHDAGAALGGTVNDVVLTAITAGFRALFEHRHELIQHPFTALVPVSTRTVGLHGEPGNHVSALVVELPVDEHDPVKAFTTINERIRRLKAHHHADGTEILLEASDHLPPPAVGLVSRLVKGQRFVNVVVTNMPGPPTQLHLGEAPISELIPIVPLGGNLTASIAILSYQGDLVLALHTDRDACPEVEIIAEAITSAFDQLTAAAKVS